MRTTQMGMATREKEEAEAEAEEGEGKACPPNPHTDRDTVVPHPTHTPTEIVTPAGNTWHGKASAIKDVSIGVMIYTLICLVLFNGIAIRDNDLYSHLFSTI